MCCFNNAKFLIIQLKKGNIKLTLKQLNIKTWHTKTAIKRHVLSSEQAKRMIKYYRLIIINLLAKSCIKTPELKIERNSI